MLILQVKSNHINDVDCKHFGHEVTRHIIDFIQSSIDVTGVICTEGTKEKNHSDYLLQNNNPTSQ